MSNRFFVNLLIIVLFAAVFIPMEPTVAKANTTPEKKPIQVKVVLERVYLDGDVSQEVLQETVWSMEDFWQRYDQWELVSIGRNQLVFRKQVDDISPLLKSNGYFGITDKGILTIFNGKPRTYNIIQSFFQIDVGKLESTKHEQLKKGIPIKNKENFVEVIETFKHYSKEEEQ